MLERWGAGMGGEGTGREGTGGEGTGGAGEERYRTHMNRYKTYVVHGPEESRVVFHVF